MDFYQAIRGRRTIRRYSEQAISQEVLTRIVDAGRMAASAGNSQPWKFIIVQDPELLPQIFDCVAWLAAAGDPPEGSRPTAYLVILGDTSIRPKYQSDCAAAMQNMSLAAHAEGMGSCWIGSIKREKVKELLGIPDAMEIYAILSLGYPEESPVSEESDSEVAASRDDQGILHIPKRKLESVLRFNRWS